MRRSSRLAGKETEKKDDEGKVEKKKAAKKKKEKLGKPKDYVPQEDDDVVVVTAETKKTKKAPAKKEAATKKKAEDEKFALAQAENCERAKKAVATFQSGVRIASTNAKGEREIMDDNAKAAEIKRMQIVVDRDCNKLPVQ